MAKLLIVESPSKKLKIGGFLGNGWKVEASLGHVRDLPVRDMGVDIAHGFKPTYTISEGKSNVVKRLKAAMMVADEIYLASDPDREGEAIAWHISALCSKELKNKKVYRVTFNSITKSAVQEAVNHPRKIDMNLVAAQQARRIVDRLVGYSVSPMASKLLNAQLSAGRVQSVCLRLVVEREREISSFVPSKYWTVDARLRSKGEAFEARMWVSRTGPDGKSQTTENLTRAQADQTVVRLTDARFQIDKVIAPEKRRRPHPPFTTSSLQQAASKGLSFSPERTMELAQRLYEAGLITYMRTDGTSVAPEAQEEARTVIAEEFGQDYVPAERQMYETKSENAQEAHEAIRPVHATTFPDKLPGEVDGDGSRLYELIWRRFVASQMADQVYRQPQARLFAYVGTDRFPAEFRVLGKELIFDGFLRLYEEPPDEGEEPEVVVTVPHLTEGADVEFLGIDPDEHTTKSPGRYTEAGLVQVLERQGIGRPSTYASMVKTVKDYGYVRVLKRQLVPTDAGVELCDFLTASFPDVFAYNFTSKMEAELDQVAGGKRHAEDVMASCWNTLVPSLEQVGNTIRERRDAQLREMSVGEDCPVCGNPLVKREGKRGPFIGCSDYPRCRYTRGDIRPTPATA